jgi:mono/diheme cytochrome c family protein
MTEGKSNPTEQNLVIPKMSDPSSSPHSASSSPMGRGEDESMLSRKSSWPVAWFKGLVNLASVGLIIYLTYFFTMYFSRPAPKPAPIPESQKALAKKAEELRAEGQKLLSTYGWINPATKAVRIPIDRAMELTVAESAQPPLPIATAPSPAAVVTPTGLVAAAPPRPIAARIPTGVTAATAPSSGAAAATSVPAPAATAVAGGTAPTPAPTTKGMAPDRIYRLVCLACHDTDGKGKIVRLAMPAIPDFTDPKWQASRNDVDLQHSILEGKGQLMLPMKEKLALAQTDVKDMVAFVRGFKEGKQVVSAAPTVSPLPAQPTQVAVGPAPSVPVSPAQAPSPAPAPAAAQPTRPAVALAPSAPTTATPITVPARPARSALSAARTSPAATQSTSDLTKPAMAPAPAPATDLAATPTPTVARLAQAAVSPESLPTVLPIATEPSPSRAEKLRAASGLYSTLCVACHGPDGRGTAVRSAMPPIPDFTVKDWHMSRSSSQLAVSIMEGKGALMPPWNSKITADQARDLVAYIRSFGAPELLAAETETGGLASMTEFDNKMRRLKQQFDDIEKQLRAMSLAPAKP